jgi:CBS domain-containing protein
MHKAQDLMRRRVIAVSPETSAEEAIDLLVQNNVSGLPVVDGTGTVVGMFSEMDRIKWGSVEGRSVEQLMSTPVVTVNVQDSLVEVARVFKANFVHRLPVTENGEVVGIIGLRDLIRYIRDNERVMDGIAPVVSDWEFFQSECWSNAD